MGAYFEYLRSIREEISSELYAYASERSDRIEWRCKHIFLCCEQPHIESRSKRKILVCDSRNLCRWGLRSTRGSTGHRSCCVNPKRTKKTIKNAASAVADAVNNRTKCDCDEIAASIEERVSELRVRFVQATVDKGDFFTARFEGKMGWLTHKAQYEQKQVDLSRLITQARGQGCAYNPEADEWVAWPFPNSPARWNSGNK